MPLQGTNTYSQPSPAERSPFRTSFFQPEGATGAHILECQVVDLNLVNWTVDVVSKYDQKAFFNVQVASPYLHFNRGEGFFAMPDVGAKCHICIPSDGPPPFVLDFIMPQETIDGATEDAPAGTESKGDVTQETTAASFAGGRKRAKPGDIGIRNRDGSFITLHRGGVLQIGATSLAQRIYIPLQNLVTDISQNYRHHNTGGSINWFVSHGESQDNPPTVSRQTYRLLANQDKATVRVAIGKVSDVLREPTAQTRSDLSQLNIGNDTVVCEVVVAPEQVEADDGALNSKTSKASVLHYFFDKGGNVSFRAKGSVNLRIESKLRLRVTNDMEVFGTKNLRMVFDGIGRIQATNGLDLVGKTIRFNAGSKPLATVGSLVQFTVTVPIPITAVVAGATVPGLILTGAVMTGIVMSGNPTLLG